MFQPRSPVVQIGGALPRTILEVRGEFHALLRFVVAKAVSMTESRKKQPRSSLKRHRMEGSWDESLDHVGPRIRSKASPAHPGVAEDSPRSKRRFLGRTGWN